MNLQEYTNNHQKLLDESYEADLQHYLSKGFDWRDAELACLITRLPIEGIPTKYKELRQRCIKADEK
jgi:hypothetical protein